MRVLLTGATGFVGRHVAQELETAGIGFVTVGRRPRADDHEHIQTDLLCLTDYTGLVRAAKATHLIHLAWYAEHGKYWTHPLNIDWIKATAGLVRAFCQEGGSHIAVSGTCAEYDWNYGYHIEDITPINPATLYGIAKDASRRICLNICNELSVPLAWGRLFFPYGRGEPESRLLPAIADVLRGKKSAFGVNGGSYRDFLHVTDAAAALVVLSKSGASGCYNISSAEAIQVGEVVRLLAQKMAVPCDAVLDMPSARPGEPNFLVGSNDRLSKIGWNKKVGLEKGLEDFLLR
jgi:nucleoside-diphosphate-sugar epimerase